MVKLRILLFLMMFIDFQNSLFQVYANKNYKVQTHLTTSHKDN